MGILKPFRLRRVVLGILITATILICVMVHYHPAASQIDVATFHLRWLPFQLPKALQQYTAQQTSIQAASGAHLPCYDFQGAEDVVFVIKTGATEAMEKLPVHFNTTLKCMPNHLIYSDYSEVIDGHEIRDALSDVTKDIRANNDDFALWRRLNRSGRAILDPSELSNNDHADPNQGGGNPGNGGWRIDKFKNLPMVVKALEAKPDAKWYLFTDADTYIVWSNLLTWLNKVDSTKKLYLGSPAVFNNLVLGHGGSGYVLSNAAMRAVAELYREHQMVWDQKAADHWAGDCVLSAALKELGIELTRAFPIIQGGNPDVMDFTEVGYGRKLWCYPVVSYHHLKASTIGSLWYLEQDWTARASNDSAARAAHPLRHSNIFRRWVLPQLAHEQADWDNLSEDALKHTVSTRMDCRGVCEGNTTCLQYSFRGGECKTLHVPKLGANNTDSVQSGWMLGRVNDLLKQLDDCNEGDWIFPE